MDLRMHMEPVHLHVGKALGFLAALAAGISFGAPALGMAWDLHILVGQVRFTLPSGFPFAFLAGALALAAWGRVDIGDGRRWFGGVGVGLAGAIVLASYVAILAWWAPWGGTAAQFALLGDVGRLGFTMLALSLPVVLPDGTPRWVRVLSGLAGLALTPLLLFPASADAAGVAGARDALPLGLFLVQALLTYGDRGQAHVEAWAERRNDAWDGWEAPEPKIESMRAHHKPMVRTAEALRGGIDAPARPAAPRRPSREGWF